MRKKYITLTIHQVESNGRHLTPNEWTGRTYPQSNDDEDGVLAKMNEWPIRNSPTSPKSLTEH